jgi:GT2 family glycosyltransferase
MVLTEPARRDMRLLVSVVVPTRDDADGLRILLDCLAAQTIKQECFEVVIGDDGSSDERIRGFATSDDRVRVLWGPPLNSYAARNRAAGATRAPVIAFCDSDCAPEPTWLESGLRALDQADVVAGVILFRPPPRPTVWTLLTIDLFCDQEHYVRQGRAAGGNLFMRRELFESLGGFDDSLPNGSDSGLVIRAVEGGATLHFAPDAVVWHPTRDTAQRFLAKTWAISRRSGIRAGREGQGPGVRSLAFWLPPLDALRARRRLGPSLGLNRRRLDASSVSPGLAALPALLLLYVLVPYVVRTAILVGWLDGRRSRRVWNATRRHVPGEAHISSAETSSPARDSA